MPKKTIMPDVTEPELDGAPVTPINFINLDDLTAGRVEVRDAQGNRYFLEPGRMAGLYILRVIPNGG